TLPSDWSDKKIVGIFDFGNTGAGNNSGFESLLFVDEQPYQGVDSNHKEVFFPVERLEKKSLWIFVSGQEWKGEECPKYRNSNSNVQIWHGLMNKLMLTIMMHVL